jgi:ABC-type proline/glycine betaine transport system permease subunit
MTSIVKNIATHSDGIAVKLAAFIKDTYLPLSTGVLFFILWEAAIRLLEVPLYILPPPSSVLREFTANFGLIWHHTLVTANETVVGYTIAAVFGIPLAILVAFSEILRRTLYPAAVTLEMVPKIAFAPIFVIWFGFSFPAKMLVVFLVCFFPILINGIFGFMSLSTELKQFSLSTGANPTTGGVAPGICRIERCRSECHGGGHDRRMDWRQRRPGILYSGRFRRIQHGIGAGRHIYVNGLGPFGIFYSGARGDEIDALA